MSMTMQTEIDISVDGQVIPGGPYGIDAGNP